MHKTTGAGFAAED